MSQLYRDLRIVNNESKFVLFSQEALDVTGSCLSVIFQNSDQSVETSFISKIEPGDVIIVVGFVGVISLPKCNLIIVITSSEPVFSFEEHVIEKILKVEILTSWDKTKMSSDEIAFCMDCKAGLLDHFENTPSFYFSYTFDICCSFRSQYKFTNYDWTQSLFERAESKYMWNFFILSKLARERELSPFLMPIMHGNIGSCSFATSEGKLDFMVVSRRSNSFAGTRYFKRGSDINGNVANFVETEHVLFAKNSTVSFIQIRGSIPISWTQYPNLKYAPPILPGKEKNDSSLIRHFYGLKSIYYDCVSINLVNQHGGEGRLAKSFEESLKAYYGSEFSKKYIAFDFHKECAKMNWNALKKLMNEIELDLLSFGFTSKIKATGATVYQKGVFRTNCIDCLDRTNVVQSMISFFILKKQIENLGIIIYDSSLKKKFDCIWADNADACSIQYSGTPAMKTDFTRTGKRTIRGVYNDGVSSVTRYVRSILQDGFKQDTIDLVTGSHPIYTIKHFKKYKPIDIRYYIVPIILLLAAICLILTLVAPPGGYFRNLTYVVFWAAIIFICIKFIQSNKSNMIAFPESYYVKK